MLLMTRDHKVMCELFAFEITSRVGIAISRSFRTGKIKREREHNKIAVSLIRNAFRWEALKIQSLSLDDLCKTLKVNHKETFSQTQPQLLQLDKLSIEEVCDNPAMW
ncbi:hypothetical protein DPMN_176055 [Dreissena polymorpha]|uniref:Uncharacterized protein n=1 Tax=Dreissena polymorpha TaxID=45954 RepID=A0A9D4E688_DREPO|nr:hypothetical protein DPMN_176055 [Dreissena polymorpha]